MKFWNSDSDPVASMVLFINSNKNQHDVEQATNINKKWQYGKNI